MKIYHVTSQSRKGFTLIELLVVISIIAILLTIGILNFVEFRKRGRDAQRKADIAKIQSALEQYRSQNGVYPIANETLPIVLPDTSCSPKTYATCPSPHANKFKDITRVYLESMPIDPLGLDVVNYNGGSYYYSSDGIEYSLAACLEQAGAATGCTNHESVSCDFVECVTDNYIVFTQP